MPKLSLASVALFALVTLPAPAAELTFDERVRAQTAIERVYYSHRIGATAPFDEAVPRTVIEKKVRRYLRQSVALEEHWATPVTAKMLLREVERMVRGTRMPRRLDELFMALGNDAHLVQECLARPVLVDRLARGFFARDERTHSALPNETDHVTWDTWWAVVAGGLDESSALVAARGDHGDMELPTVADSCAPDDTWDNGALADLPSPRRNHTIVWTGNEAVIWGGYDGTVYNTGSRYDPATDTWTPTATLNSPSARGFHTAVWTGSKMVVWGGYDDTYVDTGGQYDPVSDTWTPTATLNAPSGRVFHTAAWTGSRVIVWGGSADSFPRNPTDTGGSYDPETDTWTPTSTMDAPSSRRNHTAVWTGSKIVVWGGLGAGDTPLATGSQYDPTTDAWTPTSMFHSPSARAHHSAVWTGSQMIVWGGALDNYGFDPINTGSRYDPVADTWNPTSTQDDNVPAPRHDHVAMWTGNRMIVWGGATDFADSDSVDTGGQYDPATNTWTPTSTLNAPSKRAYHTAVWTGSLALVWGGSDSNSSFNTGGRYDPTTDAWTPTSTLGAPAARGSHTAVWTGNVMVVWGGADGSSPFDTGGKYDPALDAWTPTSTLGVPTAREDHTAVWTGSRMVVWGGAEDSGGPFVGTGGRYDPLADVWTPTSTLGAPSARRNHTAVWTGNSMVVWGGYDGTHVDTGGRYDPTSDTWMPTSTANAPPARAYHTAIWTGNRMVVWGGYDGTYFGTGGRYDPWSDTWTPTSTANAPFARGVHTAVWTGSKMIVWGGAGGVWTYFHTGGLYDPASDTWTPTSTSNAPHWRAYHTAVWTGSRMIVWGGYYEEFEYWTTFETGGRYDPVADAWTSTSTLSGPPSRWSHLAMWTGRSMIVWGGRRIDMNFGGPYYNQGGRYILGESGDGDGDGFAGCEGDCNDGDATVFPGAEEFCDGVDRDCNGVVVGVDQDGDGSCAQVDCNDLDPSVLGVALEVQGVTIEKRETTLIHFVSQDVSSGSSTSYEMAAGTFADLHATAGFEQAWCVGSFADTPAEDAGPDPGVGQGYYYLVRAMNSCGSGDWGQVSSGSSRIVTACP